MRLARPCVSSLASLKLEAFVSAKSPGTTVMKLSGWPEIPDRRDAVMVMDKSLGWLIRCFQLRINLDLIWLIFHDWPALPASGWLLEHCAMDCSFSITRKTLANSFCWHSRMDLILGHIMRYHGSRSYNRAASHMDSRLDDCPASDPRILSDHRAAHRRTARKIYRDPRLPENMIVAHDCDARSEHRI